MGVEKGFHHAIVIGDGGRWEAIGRESDPGGVGSCGN
jgi:hypothetical protein